MMARSAVMERQDKQPMLEGEVVALSTWIFILSRYSFVLVIQWNLCNQTPKFPDIL
jgi:hypothetical protein